MDLTYCALVTISSLLILVGIAVLTIVIPACGKWFGDDGAKTEFYSVRAAYWCTIVGVSVLGLVLIGGLLQHILIQLLGGPSPSILPPH
jgi:hypothetical protein